MKIEAYNLNLAGQHHATASHTLKESLRAWVGEQRPDFEGNNRGQPQSAPAPRISEAARAAQAAEQPLATTTPSGSGEAQAIQDSLEAVDSDPRLMLIRQMVKMLTGEDIRVVSSADFQVSTHVTLEHSAAQTRAAQAQAPVRTGFGIEYERHEVRTETEQTTFQATGVIRTQDGQKISFQLSLDMQRSFREESHLSLRAGDAVKKDPLVINFNGAAAQLQSQRFSFDLEGDGTKEQIAQLGANSGYLVLDRNENGKVDNGQELFGVASGDGFADLARFDGDGNGWIDENDAVYRQLRVWSPTADGSGTLASLKEKQVGALYLGKTTTPFELRDATNQSLGTIRASGVWLAENGQAGSLQQIDLSV
jgi:hypothetical protein